VNRACLRGILALSVALAGLGALPIAANASTGSTLYVDNTNKNCTDSGSGTGAAPFCTITAAAAVVEPGQTVKVAGGLYGEVDVTRSGTVAAPITFEGDLTADGLSADTTVGYDGTTPETHGFVVDGASNIAVRGFGAVGTSSAILIENSTNVTVEQSGSGARTTAPGIEVSGTSSDVTVSRNIIGGNTTTAVPIQIDAGAQNTTVTTNDVQTVGATGILVQGDPNTVVDSNTVTTQCGKGIVLSGASAGSNIENNIVDTAQNTIPEESCSSAPDSIEVDESAATNTVADYNLVDPASGGPLYAWGGTTYTSLADFTAATSQGRHDLAADPDLTMNSLVGLYPLVDSPAIDSADANAPGELNTDLLGNPRVDDPQIANTGGGVGFYDRGAEELQAPLAQLTVQGARATGGGPQDGTFTVSIENPWADSATYSISFSDNTSQTVVTSAQSFTVNHTFVPTSSGEDATVYVTDAANRPEIFAQGFVSLGSGYTAVPPTRILDTRSAIGIGTRTPIPAGSDVVVSVAGIAGVPANADAVVFNLTAVGPSGNGVLTAYPDGKSLPSTSNLNYDAGQTTPNLVTSEMSDGKIRIHVGGAGTVHLLVDLEGYYADSGAGYAPTGPARVLDTRNAIGVPGKTPLPAGGTISLSLAGHVPANTTAVAMNVTETQATGNGVLTVYPTGSAIPNASNLNYVKGQTDANEVIVPVTNDTIQFHESGRGSVHVLADLAGYYGPSANDFFTPSAPTRELDTRKNLVGVGALAASSTQMLNDVQLPVTAAAAIIFNLTETNATGNGFLTLYPGGTTMPNASNINFAAGQTRANLAAVPLSDFASDLLNVHNGGTSGLVDYILDLEGTFYTESAY